MNSQILQCRCRSTVYLSLGSNQGDRLDWLKKAVSAISSHEKIRLLGVSSVYETDPIGGVSQEDFFNIVIKVQTCLDPRTLLAACQKIEHDLGRVRNVRWGPRTIDIDLLTYDDQVIQTPELTLPHPQMQNRAFVQIPLHEVESGVVQEHPSVRLRHRNWYETTD